MECKLIVLSAFDEIVDFITSAEKSSSPVILKRPGDISEYNGKSLLSVVVLMGWNVEVFYDSADEQMEQVAMKYRVTSQKTGWSGYMMKQHLDSALMTGVKEIDEQHITLTRLCNYMADACDHGNLKQTRIIFENLKEFAQAHYKAETELLIKYRYPEQEEYQTRHEKLICAIREFDARLNQKDADAARISDYIYQDFLPSIFEHIRIDDLKLFTYIARAEAEKDA